MKKNSGIFIFFFMIIFIFLGKLIFMKGAFLGGDYFAQFYPWSKIYASSIRQFEFPFWTRYFHSGFPLMAEGQVGGFYPLNIIMFLILPFKIAYNYSTVLHFILAWFFTYKYAQKLNCDKWGASLAAFLFCFGSAYAGCFYNVVTLRTLVWFPLVLLFFEEWLQTCQKKGKVSFLIILSAGIVSGMQFLAGFLQMAAYAWIFYIIYFLCGVKIRGIKLRKVFLPSAIFILVSIITAMPQLLLSYELAGLSGRDSATLGFALWNSFLPPCILTVFFPRWLGVFGHQVYISIFGILFLIAGIVFAKKQRQRNMVPLTVVGILSFLAALGRYNPLYVLLLKLTHFYSFRNPSKFLFFFIFSASVFAGIGFSSFFKTDNKDTIKKNAIKIFSMLLAFALGIFFLVKLLFVPMKGLIIAAARAYVNKFVIGKPYHRYDLNTYARKIESLYNTLLEQSNLSDFFVLFSVLMIIAALFICFFMYKNPKHIYKLKFPILILIIVDIFFYSFHGTGFSGNIISYSYIEPKYKMILDILKADKEYFRVLPFGLLDENMPEWLMPNSNAVFGIESIAAYSPLVEASYKNKLFPLEVVDDSLGLLNPEDAALDKSVDLLRLLNVKYIISARKLNKIYLNKLLSEELVNLYELKGYLPRIFFSKTQNAPFVLNSEDICRVIEYKDGYIRVHLDAKEDGFLIFSENYYPGWRTCVDGEKREVMEIEGIIQGVNVQEGTHCIKFYFNK